MPYIGPPPTPNAPRDFNGGKLILDADQDTSVTADTDDQIDIEIAGADDFQFTANKFLVQTGSTIDMNGTELILDADADTSITADTDDQIDVKIAGADDFQFTANTFTAQSGSTIAAQALTATTITASGIITANADMLIGGTTPTLTIGDAGAEDTKIVFDGNAQDFHIGLDDTADSLVLGLGSTLGTTSHMVMDAAGAVSKPLTPAFFCQNSTSRSNVTGNEVAYTVVFDTEVFDQGSDFASNTFTAPTTGRYFLSGQVSTDAQTTTNTDGILLLVTSNRTLSTYYNPGNMEGPAATGQCSISFSGIFDMDASDTAYVQVKIYQGTQVINVQGTNTYFTGSLIA